MGIARHWGPSGSLLLPGRIEPGCYCRSCKVTTSARSEASIALIFGISNISVNFHAGTTPIIPVLFSTYQSALTVSPAGFLRTGSKADR
jgi:hypothetical protein